MQFSKRFNDAVQVLITAYHKGNLHKGSCYACAVGNMLGGNRAWTRLFGTTGSGNQYQEHTVCKAFT